MAEAKIQLPGGAVVDVIGTPDEVARIVSMLKQPSAAASPAGSHAKRASPTADAATRAGPRGYILELKAGGFFKANKRSIRDVQEALEARGYIYPVTTLSGALLDLVKKRHLGRVKEDGTWLYVHRE